MKLLGLTKEEIAFLKNLSKQIKEQDTRGTAQPYGLVITQRVVRRVDEGIGDEIWCYWQDTEYSSNRFQEFLNDMAEYYGKESTIFKKIQQAGSFEAIYKDFNLSKLMEDIDADIYEVAFNDEVDLSRFNFFLTEEAANKYIEQDKHNLFYPKTFGVHLYKNDEMCNLIQIIHKIAENSEK